MNMPFMIQNLFDANSVGGISKVGQTALGKTGAAGGFAALMGQVQNAGEKDARMMSQRPPVALKGHALIAQLKRNLQSSGASLDQLTADDSALAAIEKVLVGAGFEAKQVRNLLGELKTNAGQNGVKVSTLFEGISQLAERSIAKSKPAYLEISSLPHIETLLAKFGLTPDQIKTALSSAKVEGKGIDVERLASGLKLLRQGAEPKKNVLQEDGELEQIVSMMQQVGLTVSINRAGHFGLEGLVAALEKFAGCNASPFSKGGASVMADANKSNQAVLNHLKLMQGQLISAADCRLSLDRFAAELETAAGQHDGGVARQRPAGDWDLFVRNIQPAAPGNGGFPSSSKTSRAALLSSMDVSAPQPGLSGSHFSDRSLFQPVSGKEGLVENSPNSKSKPGQKAGLAPVVGSDAIKAGWADAIKAGVSAETNLEEAVVATAAKTGEQSVEALVRPGRAARKLTDSAAPVLGDGITRHAETADSARLSTPHGPAGRMFPYYLLDQVSRQILRSRFTNESEIQLQLKPPSLGHLKMSIENTKDGLKVSIIAESQAARDMLLSNSGDLKTALMEQGLRIDKINVETQADFNQTMADTRHGSEGSDGRKRFSGGNRIRMETAASEIEITKVLQNETNGLNLVA